MPLSITKQRVIKQKALKNICVDGYKKRFHRVLLATMIFVALASLSSLSLAETLDSLIAQKRLTIEANLSGGQNSEDGTASEDSIVPEGNNVTVDVRQPVTLTLVVATDRWFAGGSRVAPFAMKNVVIPKTSDLAINGSQRINGQTWATQTREIRLYPTKAGAYSLPTIRVTISVNTEQGVITGSFFLNKKSVGNLSFIATQPQALQGIDHFVVSSDVELNIEGEVDPDSQYRVGDALTQTISLKADSVPAMMLPEFVFENLPGMSIYQQPARVFDQSNRGSLTGNRQETRVYTFTEKGDYTIPEHTVYWWNPEIQKLTELSIPAQELRIERAAFSWKRLRQKLFSLEQLKSSAIYWIVFLILLLTAWKYHQRFSTLYFDLIHRVSLRFNIEQRRIKKQFLAAISQQHYKKACQLLYRYHKLPRAQIDCLREFYKGDSDALAVFEALNTLAFSNSEKKSINTTFNKYKINRLFPKKTKTQLSSDHLLILNE